MLLVLQLIQFRQAFLLDFSHRDYFIRYDFFEWMPGLPITWWPYLFGFSIALAVCFTLGIAYRVSAFLLAATLAYILLQEQSMYNNHYYLFGLLCVLMAFTQAHNLLSVKSLLTNKHQEHIPRWQLLAIQLQIALMYFFGGVAKLNADWLLHAQPIKSWLPQMLPFMNGFSETTSLAVAYAIAYAGLAIDLSVGFLLFTRYKWWAMLALILFHFSNSLMFSIGYFPLFGVLSLVVFVTDSEWRTAFGSVGLRLVKTNTAHAIKPSRLVAVLFSMWFAVQLLLPLRHWAMPGNVHWNMNGYYASWFMKLNDNAPLLRFEVALPGQPDRFTFDMNALTESPSQRHLIAANPFVAVKFAKDVEHYLKQKNGIAGDIKVYCDSYISLNGRPLQRKVDPTVDLTTIELANFGKYFTHHTWIVPLGSDTLVDAKVIYNVNKLEANDEI